MRLKAPLPARIASALALVGLLHAVAIPILDSDLAAWRYDHGHVSLTGALLEHDHPWDEGYTHDDARERDMVFTFADATVAPDGGVDVPGAAAAPGAALVSPRAVLTFALPPLDAVSDALTPPPRA